MRCAEPLPALSVTDFPHPEAEVRHDNNYMPKYAPIRMILSGASRSGKTVAAWNIIFKYDLLDAERIVIMTTSGGQILYSQLQDLIESTPEYEEKIEIMNELVPIDDLGLDPEEHNCILIDDFIEKGEDPVLLPYFSRSRHFNADVLFTTQAFYLVPPSYRRNSNMIALFRGSCDHRDSRNKVWRDHFNDIPFDLFDQWYVKYLLAPQSAPEAIKLQGTKHEMGHDFLLVDYETPNRYLKYRRGLHEFLAVPDLPDGAFEPVI